MERETVDSSTSVVHVRDRGRWTRTYVWRVSDCKNVSSCWEIANEDLVLGAIAGHVSCYSGRRIQSIIGACKWQFSEGLYTEMLFWRASGPIARRWIVLTCLESC
jgi:hypothetical protein